MAVAILTALGKWDRKADLDNLVYDSVIHHLIDYFSTEKRYYGLLSDMDIETAERVIERRKSGRVLRRTNK